MSKRSGRNGRVWVDKSAGANEAPTPITTVRTWTISGTRDKQDATCMGDTSKNYVAGLADGSGSFEGLTDYGVSNWKTIADGNERYMFVYDDFTNHSGIYTYGLATFDRSRSGGVNDLLAASITFSAAGSGFQDFGTF